MKRLNLAIIYSFLFAVVAQANYDVVDSMGTKVTFISTPWRVVAMTPAIAELAMAVGLQEGNLVGVSEYTDYPESLKKTTSIGPFSKPNFERIISLKPDLMLASVDSTPSHVVQRLRKMKLPVLVLKTEDLQSIRSAYEILWKAFGSEFQGKKALQELNTKITGLKERAKKRARSPKIVLQVGEDPLVVAGGKNFLNEGLELIGVTNTYSDSKLAYPRITVEDVLKRDPDSIVLISLASEQKVFDTAKKKWMGYPHLKAVKNGQVLIVKSDALVRPGPRLPDGLEILESALFSKSEVKGTHE